MSLLLFLNDLIFVIMALLLKRQEIRVFQSVLQLFLGCYTLIPWGFPGGLNGKESAC